MLRLKSAPELSNDREHHCEFLSLSRELAAPGEMGQAQTFYFNFNCVAMPFESYAGINVKLRFVSFAPYYHYSLVATLMQLSGIFCAYPFIDGCWTWSRRKTSGCILPVCLLTATTHLRWKSASKIVCISTLNMTSPSTFIYTHHAQYYS